MLLKALSIINDNIMFSRLLYSVCVLITILFTIVMKPYMYCVHYRRVAAYYMKLAMAVISNWRHQYYLVECLWMLGMM